MVQTCGYFQEADAAEKYYWTVMTPVAFCPDGHKKESQSRLVGTEKVWIYLTV